ncbi:helix-turn-helix domain-containing protein [Lacticaseibacillus paracasei]|uniref:helix-turn-helix domain-containing protein n=1 Tax=Lacticaseibacillus paracasei TaxID=1597 RepID=UPI0021E7B438|nr:helix-turn-helix transcriptional regulator [Lacticaseibacillus paracasei]UYI60215.1 helix-turn-helix domain-containing protein [Lacticaseibacillus paracasei]
MVNVNLDRLKGLMTERHVTQDSLALALGIARSTLFRKMQRGGKDFTAQEIFKMMQFIPLSDQEAIDIFLKKNKSIFSQANSLITVNVIKEDKTFGRAITKQ